jgi:hypothetical protein
MTSVTCKKDGTRRFAAGLLGNSIRQWPSLDAIKADGYTGRVVIRSTRPGWSRCRYALSIPEAEEYFASCVVMGDQPTDIYFNEYLECQPLSTTIQGEVYRGVEGLVLHYSTDQVLMRDVISRGITRLSAAYGLTAKLLLQQYLDPSSYDAVMDLLDTHTDAENHGYPTSHVIEFTTFDRYIGTLPGRNTIIWELRRY